MAGPTVEEGMPERPGGAGRSGIPAAARDPREPREALPFPVEPWWQGTAGVDVIHLIRRQGDRLNHRPFAVIACTLAAAFTIFAGAQPAWSAEERLDRTSLPIPEPKHPAYKELDVRDAKAPARFDGKAPAGAKNGIRTQFSHVIDVAPTILEAAGLPEPKSVNGTPQVPMEGTAMNYSFDDAAAKERHTTQYFEIAGNRAIYHEGWFARTIHRAPWEPKPRHGLKDDVWQLFDTRSDFSLSEDLAAKDPKKLKELQGVFLEEAGKHHVLPIDDRMFERALASAVDRPDLMEGRTSLTLAEGMTGMSENVFLNVKNKSVTITAEVEAPAKGNANGTVIAQGGRFGGWSLHVKNGVPGYEYNFLGMKRFSVSSKSALPAGRSTVRMEFAYDGGGLGKGGTATLFVNDRKVGEGRIDRTQPMIFSADETADVGIDLGTAVVEAIGAEAKSRFNGRIPKVTVAVKAPAPGADAAAKAAHEDVQRRTE